MFCVAFHIFIVGELKTSNLLDVLIILSPNLKVINRSWKGHGHVTWPILNF